MSDVVMLLRLDDGGLAWIAPVGTPLDARGVWINAGPAALLPRAITIQRPTPLYRATKFIPAGTPLVVRPQPRQPAPRKWRRDHRRDECVPAECGLQPSDEREQYAPYPRLWHRVQNRVQSGPPE